MLMCLKEVTMCVWGACIGEGEEREGVGRESWGSGREREREREREMLRGCSTHPHYDFGGKVVKQRAKPQNYLKI